MLLLYMICVLRRPEDSSQAGILVQEDELVAVEWQRLEQFEANPFPKTIPLLNQVRLPAAFVRTSSKASSMLCDISGCRMICCHVKTSQLLLVKIIEY
jgi:hypothetical protein